MFNSLKNLFGNKEAIITEYWWCKVDLTLMSYDNASEKHLPGDIRQYDYFCKNQSDIRISNGEAKFKLRIKEVLEDIYIGHRNHFKQAEPNDTSFIAIVKIEERKLNDNEIAEKVWMKGRLPHWENSHCIQLLVDAYEKVNPNTF